MTCEGAVGCADGADEAEDFDAELAEEAFGECAGGDADGGLAGAGALEHFAAVGGEPFDCAGEVGVAGAGAMQRRRGGGVVEAVVFVGDHEGDGGADGFAHADAGEVLDLVGFDFLPAAATVAALATAEFVVDEGGVDGDAVGHSFDEGDEGWAVGFAGGSVHEGGHRHSGK